eukprot:CAMPEP_0172760342 /NCGR_PEP_ID=MMETSP1074-20121228/169385_1 /TAXON_ID=2916 /ORGANISM="Ceratium fusus, Strain PA161109" /LENGTH=135 /DNA_ID=CAMNT_0013594295 /DNA_START=356 /DNA_END=761 /DNA_ORIENTATION=-
MADGGGGGGSAGINDANIVEGNEANGTPRSCCSKRLLLLPVDFSSSVQAGVMLDASNASDLSCDIGLCRASWHFTNSKGSITGRAPNKVGNDDLPEEFAVFAEILMRLALLFLCHAASPPPPFQPPFPPPLPLLP